MGFLRRTPGHPEPPPQGAAPKPGRSVYEDRAESVEPKIIVAEGRIVGYELSDGTFVEARPCCESPLECERDECWTRIV
jgi:hypothetical protein